MKFSTMEEVEDKAFSDLPCHIKCRILKCLTLVERKRARSVSNEWNLNCTAVENMCMIQLTQMMVTNNNYRFILDKLSSYSRCKRLDFVSFTNPLPIHVTFPERIREIGFHGQIKNNNLISILFLCPQLNKLEFSEIDFTDKSLSTPADHVYLPYLKTLFIKSKWIKSFIPGMRPDDAKLFEFLFGLTYGGLSCFRFFCSNPTLHNIDFSSLFNENAHSSILIRFIQKHKSTLTRVLLGTVETPLVLTLIPNINSNGKPLQLNSITGLFDIPSSFDMMFRVQYHLRILTLNDALKNWNVIAIAISQSAHSITIIKLTGDGQGRIYDFTALSSCINLEVLTLVFTRCEILPFPKLTSKMRKLHLSGPLTEKDLQRISSHQINLEKFTLQDNLPNPLLRHMQVAKIHFELFKNIISMGKLHFLTFARCLLDWNSIIKWCSDYDNIKIQLIPKEDNSGKHDGLQIEIFHPLT